MTRALIPSSAFVRAARRLVKKKPQMALPLQQTLELLKANAFDSRLRTHKLKGNLSDSWACSVAYDLRIVFRFVEQEEAEAILLQSLGSHDEVY